MKTGTAAGEWGEEEARGTGVLRIGVESSGACTTGTS
jgi:hypothetical protein